jgi:hypothetical protein
LSDELITVNIVYCFLLIDVDERLKAQMLVVFFITISCSIEASTPLVTATGDCLEPILEITSAF